MRPRPAISYRLPTQTASKVSGQLHSPLRAPRRREPEREIADVRLDVFERARLAPVSVAGRLGDEARRAPAGVEVVVNEVVEARLGDAAPECVALPDARALEGDGEVEGAARRLAHAGRDDARPRLARRDADRALVRVRGEKSDHAAGRFPAAEEFVHRPGGLDLLEVAVAARMIVRPGDGGRLCVVGAAARLVGLRVARVEEVGRADAAERAERRA